MKEKIIVLKRGQGLGGKANFLSSSDQLVRAPCTGQRKTFGNSCSYSTSEGVHRVASKVLQFGVLCRSGRSVRVLQVEYTQFPGALADT